MTELDEQQSAAVKSVSKKIIVNAGAGSGKTRTIVARINNLIKNGSDPSKIYCITFTNSAADTVKSRITKNIGYAGTLHALMFRCISKVYPSLTILDEFDSNEILQKCCDYIKFKYQKRNLSKLRLHISTPVTSEEKKLKSVYMQELKSKNAVDYTGILEYGFSFLDSGIVNLDVDHLLVDEFQDTSKNDMEIYYAIKAKNLFFVGDPRQSIFKFRGSDSSFIKNFINSEDFESYELYNNYRSCEIICNYCNSVSESDSKMTSVVKDEGRLNISEFENEFEQEHYLKNLISIINDESYAFLFRTNSQKNKFQEFLISIGAISRNDLFNYDFESIRFIKILLNIYCSPKSYFSNKSYLNFIGVSEAKQFELLKKLPVLSISTDQGVIDFLIQNNANHKILKSFNFDGINKNDSFGILEVINEQIENINSKQSDKYLGTVHSAKSKEWDNVIIPYCSNINFPHNGKDTEEERNLFYVACSRARKGLWITHSEIQSDIYGNEKTNLNISPYAKI